MSILDYFNKKKLPNPKGSLSRFIPACVIASAYEEVEKEVKKSMCYKKLTGKKLIGKKRNVFTLKERAKLGKLACQIGSMAAANRFSSMLSMRINESTMSGI